MAPSTNLAFRVIFLLATSFSSVSNGESLRCSTKNQPTVRPFIRGKTFINGVVRDDVITNMIDVLGCCSEDDNGLLRREKIGTMPEFSREDTLQVLSSARLAWNGGSGEWPQMSLKDRVEAVSKFMSELKKNREEIVNTLMWEIGKNQNDAASEFDRTVTFVEQTIAAIRDPANSDFNSEWQINGQSHSFIRRAAIGIIMCLGPFNYPLNETYATLIPALLMGNVVVMKIPTTGGLAHILTMEAFAKCFPPGVINLISGSGRTTMPPLMETGMIDGLAFIGGSNAADDLIMKHPHPHRLKLFLQLEAKNMAIFLSDMFEPENSDMLDAAIRQTVLGSLSYNGQRCTALKIIFVPKSFSKTFTDKFVEEVEALHVGLPWQTHNDDDNAYSQITPLVNESRISFMKNLVTDAVSKGAKIVNSNGGSVVGGDDSTLMIPAVLYPVVPSMKLYDEEQFGPVVPIAEYEDLETVLRYGQDGKYGQQCALFTTKGGKDATSIVDRFSSVFGKININSQCARSPDVIPFSARRSSAMGIMSVVDALKEFSIPTVVSYKSNDVTEKVVESIQRKSKFMTEL